MFVFNCTIDENRIAPVSLSNSERASKKKKQSHYKRFKTDQSNASKDEGQEEEEDILRPVLCTECGTELGAYEPKEELYHFSRILASH